jgi:glycosyltransferase involved in cell wall biosynthesis
VNILMLGHWSHTGFGVVTEQLGTRFLAAEHDVRILALNHRGEPIKGPMAGRVWPLNTLGQYFAGNIPSGAMDGTLWKMLDTDDVWTPDVVFVIGDVSSLLGYVGELKPDSPWLRFPVFHYCPIEGDNLPKAWKGIWKLFQPVAMSMYGAKVIGDLIEQPVPMLYHGVDTEVFHPASISDPVRHDGKKLSTKAACKAAFGLDPDRKVILRSDRLVERKFYDRFVTAMLPILDASPETDVLIHCRPIDEGLDLYQELHHVPERLQPQFKLTAGHDSFRGLSTESLVALINASDLYVSTTGGEGFGLNLAESMACEVPVVVTDWAADREVVGDGGVVVPPLTDSYGEPVRYHSRYGMDWAVPDPKAFTEPVLGLLNRPARRHVLGVAGRRHVIRSFSWDACAADFLTLFEDRQNADRLAS